MIAEQTMARYKQFLEKYSEWTGLNLAYNPFAHDSDLYLFHKQFDLSDLKTVIRHIQRRYREKEAIMLSMLRFTKLIRELDTFAETLAEANAMNAPRLSPRDQMLAASGRKTVETPERETQHAGAIAAKYMKRDAIREALANLKKTL